MTAIAARSSLANLASSSLVEQAIVTVGRWLTTQRYEFVTVTPLTHGRVDSQATPSSSPTVRDIFGWSRPFLPAALPCHIFDALARANLLRPLTDGRQVSELRFATAGGQLFAHSAWPTLSSNSVFFGPDSYRFIEFLRRQIRGLPKPKTIVDVGCGSGVGGILASAWVGGDVQLQLLDISDQALQFARANVELAGTKNVLVANSDLLSELSIAPDMVMCNPPYLPDAKHRIYRDGQGYLGTGLALSLIEQCLAKLAPGGCLLLYTGTAVIAGRPLLMERFEHLFDRHPRQAEFNVAIEEIDPDVFGEELDSELMQGVERIAAVGFTLTRNQLN